MPVSSSRVCCPTVGVEPTTIGVRLNLIDLPLTHIVPATGSGTSIKISRSWSCGSLAACSVVFTGAQGMLCSESSATACCVVR